MHQIRIYIAIFFALATMLFAGAWYMYTIVTDNARVEISRSLTTVRDTVHQAVKTWYMDHKAASESWAKSPLVVRSAKELLALPFQKENLLNSSAQDNLRQWFKPLAGVARYRGFFIVGPGNINLASSRNQNVAVENLLVNQSGFLESVWSGKSATSLPIKSDVPLLNKLDELVPNIASIFVAAPIRNESRKVIAIFMFRLNPEEGFSKILDQGRIGSTGESYAFDKQGRLLSESRFNEQLYKAGLVETDGMSILNLTLRDPGRELSQGDFSSEDLSTQPLTFMVQSAIDKESGVDLNGHRDYRGVPVVSAWSWDDELSIGIATELNTEEAFKTLRASQMSIIILTLLVLISLLGISIIVILYRQRQIAEQVAQKEKQKAQFYFDAVETVIVALNAEGIVTEINRKGCEILSYSRSELVGESWFEVCLPENIRKEVSAVFKSLMRGEDRGSSYYENEVLTKTGEKKLIAWHNTFVENAKGIIIGTLSTGEDITESKKAELELKRAATVFDNTDEGIIVTDDKANIILVNKAFSKITGYRPDEVLGQNPRFQQSGRHAAEFYRTMWSTLVEKGQWRGELWNRRKNGEIYPAWENINIVKNEDDSITNYVAIFSDISVLKASEERLHYLAHHDALTGLPNRMRFLANLEQAIKSAKRHCHRVALLFMDLDRFKQINDSLGHDAGDDLLKEVASRLQECVRGEDTVARLGGDEFTVILTEIGAHGDAAKIAQKIVNSVRKPVEIGSEIIETTASIGISIYPEDASCSEDMVKTADTAMYHAKAKGKNSYQVFTQELASNTLLQATIERDLRKAITRQQFELYYQPQICLESGSVMGIEALIRWRHPERGLMLPDEFIEIADECNLIDSISEWVLKTAINDYRQWIRVSTNRPRLAINITLRQMMTERSIASILDVLDSETFAPNVLQLDLEITESALESFDRAVAIMSRLKANNIMFAIDDFGTGHASLSRLKLLPIDTLKIDQSFIAGIAENTDDKTIAAAIIAIAHSLNLRVVAEGVESRSQVEILTQLGCDEVQGFYYCKPVPAEQIEKIIDKNFNMPNKLIVT